MRCVMILSLSAASWAQPKALQFDIRWVNAPEQATPRVEHRTLKSAAMRCEVGFNVYLPPGYEGSSRRYPVLYWLHGSGGHESSRLFIGEMFHRAIEAGAIRPAILVFPNGGKRTEYRDWRDQNVMAETHIIRELIPYIDATFRTIAERGGRHIEGMSMGGNGALKLAFKHPDLFATAVAYAGSYKPLPADGKMPGITEEQQRWVAQLSQWYSADDDVFVLARRNAEKLRAMRIRFIIGTKDVAAFPDAEALHRHLNELEIPHEYEVLLGVAHDNAGYYERAGERGFRFHAWK